MSAEIKVPTLGESVTSATVSRWLKQPGDAVSTDEAVVELETDKVSVEVAAPESGVLGAHAVDEGGEVEVGSLLTTVEGSSGAKPTGQAAPAQAPAEPAPAPAAAQKPAREAANPSGGVNPPPRTSGPVSRPATPPADVAGHAPLPSAAKLMTERSVRSGDVGEGTGKDGRITKGDVLAFLERPAAPAAKTAPAPAAARADDPREERVKMTRLRKTIAGRLKDAQNTAAILTTFNEVDMSAAMAMRAEYREAFEKKHNGARLGFMSIFVRACIAGLREFPAVNAEIAGDDVIYRNFVHMGIAVGGANGLVVPVLRDADQMGFAAIERGIASFGKRARDGQLKLDELTGGTFSITNGGIYGSLMSTPILNPPQSAILGMHKIQDRPIAVAGQVVIRPMMYLALSYDHRIVDGKEAVSFLVRVKEGVEDPRRLLLEI
ncbi:2-oxoglutarate dehydrogenase complex dihydrolipoyllysine-residue succinyltransferase [Lichenicoccus roseus]|uniref:Dihydrolipoyllysine-residue succinyltransferase component of 2-oxoglutarate dehydrogenase complex n=1 Tax=Lichenicoccus roseus TaxID=2683649 RepID=A0A5R9JFW0_9PROT|nr:2-oxoglutarate dehydrogenase complex dihydrolipoyllysine-residue succinyltransferase [Lichenicoccus roseus]TLU73168.1 2-oxoglutarate dehydrogenase complex dihydrolipoyllysine-residue succinyltransferase [Lichenicoccus roseus]